MSSVAYSELQKFSDVEQFRLKSVLERNDLLIRQETMRVKKLQSMRNFVHANSPPTSPTSLKDKAAKEKNKESTCISCGAGMKIRKAIFGTDKNKCFICKEVACSNCTKNFSRPRVHVCNLCWENVLLDLKSGSWFYLGQGRRKVQESPDLVIRLLGPELLQKYSVNLERSKAVQKKRDELLKASSRSPTASYRSGSPSEADSEYMSASHSPRQCSNPQSPRDSEPSKQESADLSNKTPQYQRKLDRLMQNLSKYDEISNKSEECKKGTHGSSLSNTADDETGSTDAAACFDTSSSSDKAMVAPTLSGKEYESKVKRLSDCLTNLNQAYDKFKS